MAKTTGKRVLFVNVVICCILLHIIPNTLAKVTSTILTTPFGSFSTPKFPSNYPPATEYIWLIKAKDGMYVKLTFDVVDIEAYKGKCIDIVEVKDGDSSHAPLIGSLCNSDKPTHSFMSSSNTLRIWFQSARNSDGGAGFNASYTTLKDHECGGQLQSFPGSFSTPRYPLPYPNNRKCVWTIMAESGKYIYVEFHGIYHLELQCHSSPCACKDTLDILDSNKSLPYPPHIGYCAVKPREFTSKTNSVSVIFVANDAGRYEGFNATYTTSLTPGCGADLNANEGIITSPNYPHGYRSYSRCIWRITVARDRYVSLTFHAFDINKGQGGDCVDSLDIHDGYTKDSQLLGKLCNGNSVAMVNSTGNQLLILFQSGFNGPNAKGFKATFNSHLKIADGKIRKPRHRDELETDNSYSRKSLSNFALTLVSTPWCFAFQLVRIFASGP